MDDPLVAVLKELPKDLGVRRHDLYEALGSDLRRIFGVQPEDSPAEAQRKTSVELARLVAELGDPVHRTVALVSLNLEYEEISELKVVARRKWLEKKGQTHGSGFHPISVRTVQTVYSSRVAPALARRLHNSPERFEGTPDRHDHVSSSARGRPDANLQVPSELVAAWRRKNLTLFLGAGASGGGSAWSQLTAFLCKELPEIPKGADLPTTARYFELTYGYHRLRGTLSAAAGSDRPNDLHNSVALLEPRTVYVTSFDDRLERAFRNRQYAYTLVVTDDEIPYVSASPCPLIKPFGALDRPGSLVVTSRDHELFETRHPGMAELLSAELHTKTLLFIGYSVTDPDFRAILTRMKGEPGLYERRAFFLSDGLEKLEQLELASRGITVIEIHDAVGADYVRRVVDWIRVLLKRAREEESSGRSESADREVEYIEGKTVRTASIVKCARRILESGRAEHMIVRMRQGYSALSLGDNDHPDDPHYSELLKQERDAFRALLSQGAEMRLIVGRRPIFSSDLSTSTARDVILARRLRDRCQRLLGLVRATLETPDTPRLLVVCSTATHFADVAFGPEALYRGVRSDSASGYTVTVVNRSSTAVDDYCRAFDSEFERLCGVNIGGQSDRNDLRMLNSASADFLANALATLNSWLSQQGDAGMRGVSTSRG
ncbi:SIR2 family NAD-dependent protein deacylase [Streptomyces sp. NPDC054770]